MRNLLYLVHRLPFPPNKGDKVRSYHLLKHLSTQHRVFLGTFIDDPQDEAGIATLRQLCPDLKVVQLKPRLAQWRSLSGLWTQQALSLPYYRDAELQAWVNQTISEQPIDAVVVFSCVMAQYVEALPEAVRPPMLVDFVDVDSAKWTQYATRHRWPWSWLYQREGQHLLSYERALAARCKKAFFVTEHEAALFRKLAPECAANTTAISNGVDTDYFSPDPARASPFEPQAGQPSMSIVFTGAMDYWPNIDAVTWFVGDILPLLRPDWPQLRFYIVGRNPPASVLALADEAVVVTGTVPDIRPYLQHATLVVAPLRVARGIQNKILEAMAMACPVLASRTCAAAIDARAGEDLVSASGVTGFVREVNALLKAPAQSQRMGQAARRRVLQRYSWDAHLCQMDRYLSVPLLAGEQL